MGISMEPDPTAESLPADLAREVGEARAAGRRLGRYLLLGSLGAGAMGTVYRAFDPELRRLVAVKLLAATGPRAERARARFRREAQAVARLRHPNIVPVHDVGASNEGRPFIVMELVEGGANLRERFAAGSLDLRAAARIAARVARALHYAHAEGIVHRDVKPENILIDADGEPHLADFGLALDLTRDGRLTQVDEVVGTVLYMAPEQVDAEAPVGPATDVWALGAILHEVVYRKPAFPGDSAITVIAGIVRHRGFEPPPGAPPPPRGWVELLRGCLARDPADRTASAEALAEQLERLARPSASRAIGVALAAVAAVVLLSGGIAIALGLSRGAAPSDGGRTTPAVDGPVRLVIVEPRDELITPAASITVRGRVAGPSQVPVVLTVAGRHVELGEDRTFTTEVALVAGANAVDVVMAGAGSDRGVELVIVHDPVAPRITIDPPPPLELWGDDRTIVIAGRLGEDGCRVACNGAAAVVEGRAFRVEVTLPEVGRNPIRVEATDAAGNLTLWETDAIYHETEPARPVIPADTWWRPSPRQVSFAHEAGAPLWFRNEVGIRMVLIPPGRFVHREDDGAVRYEVTISRGFYIAATEATNAELRAFDPEFRSPPFPAHARTADEDDRPAIQLSRDEAREFAASLGERVGVPGAYRLPTGAEWEHAARAGSTRDVPWGPDAARHEHANTGESQRDDLVLDGHEFASPVGSYPPNRFGLFDVIGNAWEWVDDGSFSYGPEPVIDPVGPADGEPMCRGGSWFNEPWLCTFGNMHRIARGRTATSGFRVAASLRAAEGR